MIMIFTASDRIFDTLFDTRRIRVFMKTKFYLRNDVIVDGKNPIYLRISGNNNLPERIHLDLYVEKKNWHAKEQRVFLHNEQLIDVNLILKNITSKLTNIETVYRLSGMVLTPKLMRREYEDKLSRVNFVAFFKNAAAEQKSLVCPGRLKMYNSVLKKLEEYQSYIPFNELTISWFNNYRNHLKFKSKNGDTTIASNFAVIKKFLKIATKNGIRLLFDIDDLYVGNTKGNRTYLSIVELRKCLEFYYSPYINESYRLILGYFLFSCMNGLRISNVQSLNRKELLDNDLSLILVKGNKDKNLIMNKTAQKIVAHDENLFITKFADQYLNDQIKKIMIILGIKKHVTFHVARHTFATLFLKAGGKVEMLQQILGHSSIVQTMVYVHIVQAEANDELFLLDELIK